MQNLVKLETVPISYRIPNFSSSHLKEHNRTTYLFQKEKKSKAKEGALTILLECHQVKCPLSKDALSIKPEENENYKDKSTDIRTIPSM
jgi:hypothetical protein